MSYLTLRTEMCVEKFYSACEKYMNEPFQLLEVLEVGGVGEVWEKSMD